MQWGMILENINASPPQHGETWELFLSWTLDFRKEVEGDRILAWRAGGVSM